MKVQKKESKQSGNPARSLILVTVCTCTAIAFAAGGRIADFNGKNKVYAASENREKTFFPLMLTKQMYCQQELQE